MWGGGSNPSNPAKSLLWSLISYKVKFLYGFLKFKYYGCNLKKLIYIGLKCDFIQMLSFYLMRQYSIV